MWPANQQHYQRFDSQHGIEFILIDFFSSFENLLEPGDAFEISHVMSQWFSRCMFEGVDDRFPHIARYGEVMLFLSLKCFHKLSWCCRDTLL